MPDKTLDVRGLSCPLPVLKAAKAIKDLGPGATLEVLATDPGSVPDFEAFCTRGRHELIERDETDGVYRFLIRRAA